MPYIIRNKAGDVVGLCTNKPGDGNRLPDGSIEIREFYEDDPNDKAYDADKAAEAEAFAAAQAAKRGEPRSVSQKLATLGITPAELKAELAK